MSLRELFGLLRQNTQLLVGGVVLGVLIAGVLSALVPPGIRRRRPWASP